MEKKVRRHKDYEDMDDRELLILDLKRSTSICSGKHLCRTLFHKMAVLKGKCLNGTFLLHLEPRVIRLQNGSSMMCPSYKGLVELKNGSRLNIYHETRNRVAIGLHYCICGKETQD